MLVSKKEDRCLEKEVARPENEDWRWSLNAARQREGLGRGELLRKRGLTEVPGDDKAWRLGNKFGSFSPALTEAERVGMKGGLGLPPTSPAS